VVLYAASLPASVKYITFMKVESAPISRSASTCCSGFALFTACASLWSIELPGSCTAAGQVRREFSDYDKVSRRL